MARQELERQEAPRPKQYHTELWQFFLFYTIYIYNQRWCGPFLNAFWSQAALFKGNSGDIILGLLQYCFEGEIHYMYNDHYMLALVFIITASTLNVQKHKPNQTQHQTPTNNTCSIDVSTTVYMFCMCSLILVLLQKHVESIDLHFNKDVSYMSLRFWTHIDILFCEKCVKLGATLVWQRIGCSRVLFAEKYTEHISKYVFYSLMTTQVFSPKCCWAKSSTAISQWLLWRTVGHTWRSGLLCQGPLAPKVYFEFRAMPALSLPRQWGYDMV